MKSWVILLHKNYTLSLNWIWGVSPLTFQCTVKQITRIWILNLNLPWSIQVSLNCPVSNEKDRLLLTIGTELYQCLDPDTLLPYLIKDIPSMPVVQHQLKINANTAGSIFFTTWKWGILLLMSFSILWSETISLCVCVCVCVRVSVCVCGRIRWKGVD